MDKQAVPDFFVSYTAVDEAWAVWICVQLEQAGYTTVSQALDFRPGHDFLHKMQVAARDATRTIAILSAAYADSRFGEAEWRTAFEADPTGDLGMLIPVRVQYGKPTGVLSTRVYVDLVGLAEQPARERLLAAVGPALPRPTSAPYPGVIASAVSDDTAVALEAQFPGDAGLMGPNPRSRNSYDAGRSNGRGRKDDMAQPPHLATKSRTTVGQALPQSDKSHSWPSVSSGPGGESAPGERPSAKPDVQGGSRQSPRWPLLAGQVVAGLMVGAATWTGFAYLWAWLPLLAGVLSVVIVVATVFAATALGVLDRLGRAVAAAIGLLLGASPALVVWLG